MQWNILKRRKIFVRGYSCGRDTLQRGVKGTSGTDKFLSREIKYAGWEIFVRVKYTEVETLSVIGKYYG